MFSAGKAYVIPIKRFETGVFPFFSQKILHHRSKIGQLSGACDWDGLSAELRRSSLTLKQLQHSLTELEDVRLHLDDTQQLQFDSLFCPIRDQARQCVCDFIEYQMRAQSVLDGARNSTDVDCPHTDVSPPSPQLQLVDSVHEEEQLLVRRHDQLEAHRRLQSDMEGLHEVFTELGKITATQGELVDSVSRHVEVADENVREGTQRLSVAARLAGGVAPAAGALIGGLVAGPVGLLAGVKVGGLAAVGGGILGYVGGRVVNLVRTRPCESALPRSASAPAGLTNSASAKRPGPGWIAECPLDALLSCDVEEAEEAGESSFLSSASVCSSSH